MQVHCEGICYVLSKDSIVSNLTRLIRWSRVMENELMRSRSELQRPGSRVENIAASHCSLSSLGYARLQKSANGGLSVEKGSPSAQIPADGKIPLKLTGLLACKDQHIITKVKLTGTLMLSPCSRTQKLPVEIQLDCSDFSAQNYPLVKSVRFKFAQLLS